MLINRITNWSAFSWLKRHCDATCDVEDPESEEESLPDEDDELEDELPLLEVADELLHRRQ